MRVHTCSHVKKQKNKQIEKLKVHTCSYTNSMKKLEIKTKDPDVIHPCAMVIEIKLSRNVSNV